MSPDWHLLQAQGPLVTNGGAFFDRRRPAGHAGEPPIHETFQTTSGRSSLSRHALRSVPPACGYPCNTTANIGNVPRASAACSHDVCRIGAQSQGSQAPGPCRDSRPASGIQPPPLTSLPACRMAMQCAGVSLCSAALVQRGNYWGLRGSWHESIYKSPPEIQACF